MKNLVIKTFILIATLIGTIIPISLLNSNNFEEQNYKTRSPVPEIIGSNSKYNTLENRVEFSFYLNTTSESDITNQDLYFSTEENPSTPLLSSSYGMTSINIYGQDCIELNVFEYQGDLEFGKNYWIKIVSPNSANGVEISGGTTLLEGEVVKTNIDVTFGYDTISFVGDFTQPTLDYYDEIEWTITDTFTPINTWTQKVPMTNFTHEVTETFDVEMANVHNGITPETKYEVLIIANEKDDDDFYEIFNTQIITDEPPYVEPTSESYVIESKVDYFEITYKFEQPFDANYSVKDLTVDIYDKTNSAKVSTTVIAAIEGSLVLNEGTSIRLEGNNLNSIIDESNYTIIGTLNYESNITPSYKYEEEAFTKEKTTSGKPAPIVEEALNIETIDHDSIEKDFKLTQPYYDSKPRYDAEKLKVTLFESGQTAEIQFQEFDKTEFENKDFTVNFDLLLEGQAYTLQFSYYILEEPSTWIDIESFDFQTIEIPRPIGSIIDLQQTSYSVKWDLSYTQASSDDQYNATEIEWVILEEGIEIQSGTNLGSPISTGTYTRTSTLELKPDTNYTIEEKYKAPFNNPTDQYELATHSFTTDTIPRPMASIVINDITSYSVSWDLNYIKSGDEEKFDAKKIEWVILEEGTLIEIETGTNLGSPISTGTYTRTSTLELKPDTNYTIVEKYKAEYDAQAMGHDLDTIEFTTPTIPRPTGEIIFDELNITPNSVEWDLNYTQSGDEEKFDAKEIEWVILEEGTLIETGTNLGSPISTEIYPRTSTKLKPDTNYTIEESYKADYDLQVDWHDLDTIEFRTPSQPKGTFVINDSWAGYNTLEFNSTFTQPEHLGFLIEKFEWKLLDSSSNPIIDGIVITHLNAPTEFIIDETNISSLEINNKYTLEVKQYYADTTLDEKETEWEEIKTFETYDVIMPTKNDVTNDVTIIEQKEEITIEFEMFNVPREWESNQRTNKSIDNNDLNEMSFDEVHFSLYTMEKVLVKENIIINEGKNNLNEIAKLSTTFQDLESDTEYEYEISVWRANNKTGELEYHKYAFTDGISGWTSGETFTLYKFPLQYVIYPLIILIVLTIIFLIYKDLTKQQKLRNKVVSDIFSLVEDLKISLTPYIIPVGYEEYKTLIKEPKEALVEKLIEQDKEWSKKDSKKTLAKLITGFSDEEIKQYEKDAEFEYKKEDDEYDELLGEYSATLLNQQSKIKRFFNEKIFNSKPKTDPIEENNIEQTPKIHDEETKINLDSKKEDNELEQVEPKAPTKETTNPAEPPTKKKTTKKKTTKPPTKKPTTKDKEEVKTEEDVKDSDNKQQKVVVDDE